MTTHTSLTASAAALAQQEPSSLGGSRRQPTGTPLYVHVRSLPAQLVEVSA